MPCAMELPRHPIVYGPELVEDWPAFENWRIIESSSSISTIRPDFNHLRSHYGHHVVQVANTKRRQFNEFERTERPLKDVIDRWAAGDAQGDGLYVKDWHLALQLEDEGGKQEDFYKTPELFQGEYLVLEDSTGIPS